MCFAFRAGNPDENDLLYFIDVETGLGDSRLMWGLPETRNDGLAFDNANEILYGRTENDDVYRINTHYGRRNTLGDWERERACRYQSAAFNHITASAICQQPRLCFTWSH